MRYVIEGKPIPLQRVRFMSDHCYDAQKAAKRKASIEVQRQHGFSPLLSGPLKLVITFFFVPSKPVTKRHMLQSVTNPHELRSHVFRPDLSNLIKFIEDIAIGVLYNDDSIIAEISARKCYDSTPRTEFELIQLER